jgi:hypothetical protein
MASTPVLGVPGIRASRTATPRKVMLSEDYKILYPGSKIIDGSKSRDPLHTGNLDILRAGVLMGKITASGKYAPSFIGKTTADYTSGATSLTVSPATAVEIVRRVGATGALLGWGAPTATGTVVSFAIVYSAVNVTTGVLTITNIGANVDEGCLIGAGDGSIIPVAVIGDGYGIKVTDEDAASIDVPFNPMVIGGILDVTQVINWPDAEDTTLRTWVKGYVCDHFICSDDF